jgi:hypothetical protein
MRARNIKPSFFVNADLVGLPPLTRLLFIGLWCAADREGRLEDKPMGLKLKIMPGDNIDVNAALDELAALGFVVRYVVEGQRLIFLPAFLKHQKPHSKEQPSILPGPLETTTKVVASTDLGNGEHALNPESGYLNPDSGLLNPEKEISSGNSEAEPPVAKKKPVLDSADNYPIFKRWYTTLKEWIAEAHPTAKIPEKDSPEDIKWRKTLRDLVRLDKHTEEDVMSALDWTFHREHRNGFWWGDQVHSIAALRNKTKSGALKMAAIIEAWRAAEPDGAEDKLDG